MNITILTGAVGSGKTTQLLNYCKQQTHAVGILTPVFKGKRHFMNIETQELNSMEAEENEKDFVSVGKYRFSTQAFRNANEVIINSSSLAGAQIVIDEIGPLELQGKGFYNTLSQLLSLNDPAFDLLLVIREDLVEKVIAHFNLAMHNIRIIHTLS